MWAMRLCAPSRFEQLEIPAPRPEDLRDGELLVRFKVGGLCGSDTPKFEGRFDPDDPYIGQPCVPLHEVLGIVEVSRDPAFAEGDRVVGLAPQYHGLSELVVTTGRHVVQVDPRLTDIAGITIQPVATVLNALSTLPDLPNRDALVLGLGPLGLVFTHVLHDRGFRVTGIDRVDRTSVAGAFGIDTVLTRDIREWARAADHRDDFGLAVDAVGHHQGILADAIGSLTPTGHMIVFGLPEDDYVFPMRRFFRRHLSMRAGTTRDWPRFLSEAQAYVLAHPELHEAGVTDVFHPFEAEKAFLTHARPAAGRLKVLLATER